MGMDAISASDMGDVNETNEPKPTEANRFSVCGGWCLWLTCLTFALVARQAWRVAPASKAALPVTAKFVVDLNWAESSELQALPEVGTALASRIIDYRQSHGSFSTLEDLLQVPGVGPRTLEQLRPMLSIAPESVAVGDVARLSESSSSTKNIDQR